MNYILFWSLALLTIATIAESDTGIEEYDNTEYEDSPYGKAGLTVKDFAGAAGLLPESSSAGHNDDYYDEDQDDTVDPTTEADLFEGDIAFPEGMNISFYTNGSKKERGTAEDGGKESAINSQHRIWTNGIIPYVVSEKEFNRRERRIIASAILEFSKTSCIKWVQRRDEEDFVTFTKSRKGCSSMVGRLGWQQHIMLGSGCFQKGVVIHEMMHTVGFFHEQSRADRDTYITVNVDNIDASKIRNFQKYTVDEIDHLGTKYDCSSIMHYGPYAFSKKSQKLKTIVAKIQECANLGQREKLSRIDIQDINILYKCNTTAKDTSGGDKLPSFICGELNERSDSEVCSSTIMQSVCAATCSNKSTIKDKLSSKICKELAEQTSSCDTAAMMENCGRTCKYILEKSKPNPTEGFKTLKANQGCEIHNDTDIDWGCDDCDDELTDAVHSDHNTCCGLCRENKGCVAYIWYYNVCYFKQRLYPQIQKSGRIMGIVKR